MLLGTSLSVACIDTLVTLAKGWLYWDDERAVQEFSKGYICHVESCHHRKVILKPSFCF